MPAFANIIRGCGLALAGAVVAGTMSLAPAQAMPVQAVTPLVAVNSQGVETIQYRDWDRRREWRRWERHREMRRWERHREMRGYDRPRRHRDWQRRNFY